MAKKPKNSKLDDFSLDDFDDLDFGMDDLGGDPHSNKDDRKAITKKVAKAVAGGAMNHLKDPRTQIKFIKNALPKGYDTAIDSVDSGAKALRELYDTASKEVREVGEEMKGAVRAILPDKPGMLPEKIHAKLKNWSKKEPGSARMSDEAIENASLAAQLGDIFKLQAEDQQRRDKADEAKGRVRDLVNSKLQLGNLQQLEGIRQGIGRMVNYQDQITLKYQQKSLELQYRQYFVQKRLLGQFGEYSKMASAHLEAIQKNTGLPDFVKMRNVEVLSLIHI